MNRGIAVITGLIALAGFFMSLAAHAGTYLDRAAIPAAAFWLLHLGSVLVLIPVAHAARELGNDQPGADYWSAVLRGCPGWMRIALWTLALYAVVNFALYLAALEGLSLIGGAENYRRGFSGHWMIFYLVSFTVMYSYLRVRSRSD